MDRKLILDTVGRFTWDFGNKFFIETDIGNFIWSCPSYEGGDNTIVPTNLSYKKWIKPTGFGRDKGRHTIRDYCGEDVSIVKEDRDEV